ncbi:MAG: MogA/MoaB family molybdenum cofactor biosynthesis protein [Gemmatimonadota bacterium]
MTPAPVRVGVLTISDGVFQGSREDRSGELVAEWVRERGFEQTVRAVAPDDTQRIVPVLVRWCDERECDLVVTTGGTGFAERDVTPEATRAAIEREAPGLAESIRARGLSSTPLAGLSRGIAGLRGHTLIVNLPGSPAAVADGLSVLSEVVDHAVALLRGRTEHG